jgi:hypothetical protein
MTRSQTRKPIFTFAHLSPRRVDLSNAFYSIGEKCRAAVLSVALDVRKVEI